MSQIALTRWHQLVRAHDRAGLDALIAQDAVFHSPVVHRPQCGRALVVQYLRAAFAILGNNSFRYVREVVGERDAALEFEVEVDGVQINGVDLIRWDDSGLIADFKVMIRPLKAIDLVHRKMAAMLQSPR
jgi:SnoaL-like domain